ncbi:co-regulatory protein PtrA N-terminal domain-containing protein [Pseudomonas sp. NPDC078700]|uniref:co-regulatory protein PtrA N-terminal domain-containing protein n=1 Tax=Pseudomonas sp. NPDC078700 TaxID=3364424 RepID=UPI0037C77AA9
MKLLKSFVFVGALVLASVVLAEGGGDRTFKRMQEMSNRAEAVLIKAETAPANERHVHMKQHMAMLEEIMSELHDTHPEPNISAAEHLIWMEAHDKVVDDVLNQMIREHKLMMADKECHP